MKNKTLGQKIAYYRKRAGLSQLQLELEIAAGQGSIPRIENGQVNPTKETLGNIAEKLNLNKFEISELFGIDIKDVLDPVLKSNLKIFQSLNLEDVLQESVEEIVHELNFLNSFIALVEGGRLYAYTSTDNWSTQLATKVLGRNIKGFWVPIQVDSKNLMVQSVIQNRYIIGNNLSKFLYPAIKLPLAKLLEKVSNAKSCISIPIEADGKIIGAILFGKTIVDSYEREIPILQKFSKFLGVAINNAKKYEDLKLELERLKNEK